MSDLEQPTITLSSPELKALLVEAGRKGAQAALHEIGLNDEKAVEDIRNLRQLLAVWRLMARSSLGFLAKVVTVAILIFLGWLVGVVPVGRLVGG